MQFSETYLRHFSNPLNIGELSDADAVTEVEHQGDGCFDRIRISLKVRDGRVESIQFKARACSGTIAAASAATEWAKGRPVSEAVELSADTVERELDGVPEKKRHSVELAAEAVRRVVELVYQAG